MAVSDSAFWTAELIHYISWCLQRTRGGPPPRHVRRATGASADRGISDVTTASLPLAGYTSRHHQPRRLGLSCPW